MSLALRYVSAALGILRRDAAVFASYRLRFATQTAATLFTLLLFYYISRLVRVEMFPSPDEYFAFVTVGLVIFGVLTSTRTRSCRVSSRSCWRHWCSGSLSSGRPLSSRCP